MICLRCLSRAPRASRFPILSTRSLSSTCSNPSAAEPFTTPIPASPSSHGQSPIPEAQEPPTIVRSSVPAGTVLKGLNYMKDKSDPVAMEDSQYPDWLWTILDSKQGSKGEGVQEKAAAKLSKKAAKKKAKQMLEGLVDRTPLYEQTIDLPTGDGSEIGTAESHKARQQLNKAMRTKRRADIKEDNFLRAMG